MPQPPTTIFKRPTRSRRECAIPVRFSDAEHTTLTHLARSSGMSIAAFLRDHFGQSHIRHQAIERRRQALRNLWNANLEMIATWTRSYKTLEESVRVIAHLQVLDETLMAVLNLWDISPPRLAIAPPTRLEQSPRNRVVRLRVSKASYDQLHKDAKRNDTTASAMFRDHFATVRIRERPLEQEHNNLIRHWNGNLNKIAHWVNAYQGSAATNPVITRLASLEYEIALFAEESP